MVAVSRVEVDHDGYGGTALDAMVWDNVSILKSRIRVVGDHASPGGASGFGTALGVACASLPLLKKMSLSGPSMVSLI